MAKYIKKADSPVVDAWCVQNGDDGSVYVGGLCVVAGAIRKINSGLSYTASHLVFDHGSLKVMLPGEFDAKYEICRD